MGLKLSIFFLLLVSFSGLISCSEDQSLGEVDLQIFRNDRGGCKNNRQQQIDKLEAVKDSLLGKSENEIIKLLGRYDVQVLDRRQKKIFVYYLEKGIHCESAQEPSFGRTMSLRFNAVSLVNEVDFQIGLP